MRVVATAGHVDHGKSSLVRALTGTDPDRFAEEKERGLTIDLGFAFGELPSGEVVGFVDVPGHVRFVKNMLAGVGAVDVALLVVAANEGWMPQTEEHWQILRLLEVQHGLVALTKTSLVDRDACELAQLEIGERTSWPVVAVDSVTGSGLDDVRAALDALLGEIPPPADRGRPRLWIDRVFAPRGAGTVVTGTLVGGELARDQEVVVEPGGLRARIRRIESHHAVLEQVSPGTRVALNLAGVDHTALHRGHAAVLPGQWSVVDLVDVALRPLPGFSFARRSRVDVHIGSGEQQGRLRILDADARFGRITLETPVPLAPGDRLVLRSSARAATVGGATVLDVAPARRTADARARLELPLGLRVLVAQPWCTRDEAARLAGDPSAVDREAVAIGDWLVAPAEVARVTTKARELTGDGWPSFATVAAQCGVTPAQLRAVLGDDAPLPAPDEDPHAKRLIAALDAAPFSPPDPADLGARRELVRALVQSGALVDLDGVVFSKSALDQARTLVGEAVVARRELTVADVRDLLQSTRKYVLPIVNRMDAEGITRRRGDLRIPGPRAAANPPATRDP
jgi:selenocysteine-specific elongation factor